MAYCIKCGKQLEDGAKFCTGCGAQVAAPAAQQSAPAQPQPIPAPAQPQTVKMVQPVPAPAQPKPPKDKLPVGVSIGIIASAAVLSLGLAVGTFFFVKNLTADSSSKVEDYADDEDEDIDENTEKLPDSDKDADKKSDEQDDTQVSPAPAPQPTEAPKLAISMAEKNEILANKSKEIQSHLESLDSVYTAYDNTNDIFHQYDITIDGYIGAYTMKRESNSNLLYAFNIKDQNLYVEVWDVDDDGNTILVQDPYGSFLGFGELAPDRYDLKFYFWEGKFLMQKRDEWFISADGGTDYIYMSEYKDGNIEQLVNDSLLNLEYDPQPILEKAAEELTAVDLEGCANHVLSEGEICYWTSYLFDPLFVIHGRAFEDGKGGYFSTIEQYKDDYNYYIFENANTSYLTDAELNGIDPKIKLWLGRNEIYARHHRKFKDENLTAYYEKMPWYWGEYDEIPESELNDYEKANIALIKQYEEKYKEEIENEKKQFSNYL